MNTPIGDLCPNCHCIPCACDAISKMPIQPFEWPTFTVAPLDHRQQFVRALFIAYAQHRDPHLMGQSDWQRLWRQCTEAFEAKPVDV